MGAAPINLNFGKKWESDFKLAAAEGLDFFTSTWFLATELVAGESEISKPCSWYLL